MSMVPFFSRFPDLAARETRSAVGFGNPDLPERRYGFIELYCDEADCDCRRVLIHVVTPEDQETVLASINYGWESPEFYQKWYGGPRANEDGSELYLDPLNPQSCYSGALLMLFKVLLEDPEYAERLKRHYWLFKGSAKGVLSFPSKRKSRTRKRRR